MPLLFLLATLATVAPAPEPLLDVVRCGAPSTAVPFRCGVLARPAAFADGELAWLEDADGTPVPCVLHARGQRVLAHGILPAESCGGALRAVSTRDDSRIPELAVDRRGEVLVIRSARVDLELGPGAVFRLGGIPISIEPSAIGTWTQHHRCPLLVEALFEGRVAGSRTSATLRLSAAVDALSERVEIGLHVAADERALLEPGASLSLAVGQETVLEFEEGSVPVGDEPLQLHWQGGAWGSGEEQVAAGPRARWIVRLRPGSAPASLSIAIPGGRAEGFEQLTSDPGGGVLTAWWTGAGTTLERGEGRLFRAALAVDGPADAAAFAIPRRLARIYSSLAGAWRPSPTGEEAALVTALRPRLADFLDSDRNGLVLDGPGAGDWRMDREGFGNLEFDTVLGLLAWATAERSPAAWQQALAGADHLLGWDLDAAGSGWFFHHGRAHRSGQLEAGHHWNSGLVLLDAWTDEPLRSAVLDRALPKQLETFGRLDLHHELPRSLGWGLEALVAGALRASPNEPWQREIRRWVRHLESRASGLGVLQLTPDREQPGIWREKAWIQGGIILPALTASLAVAPSEPARKLAAGLARALVEHALYRTREGWRLASDLVIEGRSGRLRSRSGAERGEEIALFVAGVSKAVPALRDHAALRELAATIPGRLAAGRKTYIGKELSMLLRALPELR